MDRVVVENESRAWFRGDRAYLLWRGGERERGREGGRERERVREREREKEKERDLYVKLHVIRDLTFYAPSYQTYILYIYGVSKLSLVLTSHGWINSLQITNMWHVP